MNFASSAAAVGVTGSGQYNVYEGIETKVRIHGVIVWIYLL